MLTDFQKEFPNAQLNGHPVNRLPNNLNVSFPGVESKAIVQSVKDKVSISVGSACTTSTVEASHVISALGFSDDRPHSSIRLSVGRMNNEEEIIETTRIILKAVKLF